MIPLHEVDVDRLEQVRSGELSGRGCGKTILRMADLLNQVRRQNHGKFFLYVAENANHCKEIKWMFNHWLRSIGIVTQSSRTSMRIIATINHPEAIPTSFIGRMFARFFPPKKEITEIVIDFFWPSDYQCVNRIRGVPYDKVIEDISISCYDRNRHVMHELWAVTNRR